MASRDPTPAVQIGPREALALRLATWAAKAAAEALHAGGYPRPTDAQFAAISAAISQASLPMAFMVDLSTATDEQLHVAAESLGLSVLVTLMGPPRVVN